MADDPLPREGRLAGVDYGTVRIGVALCDARQSLASPFENYRRRDLTHDAAYFCRLVAEEQVRGFVVGLPVHLSGEESGKSYEARTFGKWLADATGVPVGFFDERFSSHEAEQALLGAGLTKKRRKARLDMLAAQSLLAAFLDSQQREQTPAAPLDDRSGHRRPR